MMLSIFSYVIFFDSFIYSSEEIAIHIISGKFRDLSNSLVNIIVFTPNNFMLYLILSGSLVFISDRVYASLWNTSYV